MNQHDRSSRPPPVRSSAPGQGWFDGIARNLILSAARRAPSALSERLQEEWLADLIARSGPLSQLGFALGCRWATTVIAHEFGAPVQAAAAAVVNKTTVVHQATVQHVGFGPSFSRRTTVILLIVGLHVLMIYVLATAIVAPRVLRTSPPPRIEFSLLPRPEPPVPPTPVDPTLKNFRFDLPMPPGPMIPTEHPDATARPITPGPQIQPADPPLPRPLNRVLGGPGAGFPNTDDFYPEAARRIGEKGITTVNVCVDGAGWLIGKPTIAQSSGSARLDEGALKLAHAGSGHYRATTEDGRPVSACYPYRVRFQLKD